MFFVSPFSSPLHLLLPLHTLLPIPITSSPLQLTSSSPYFYHYLLPIPLTPPPPSAHALPLFRDDKTQSLKRKREKERLDPVKSRKPQPPVGKKGKEWGGRGHSLWEVNEKTQRLPSLVAPRYIYVVGKSCAYALWMVHSFITVAAVMTCTFAICGRAHMRLAKVQLFPRGCNVFATWKQLHFDKSHMCKSANRKCARHDSHDLPGHRNLWTS